MTTTADSTERRREILDAALKVFSAKGFHKATNKDVAEEAGISPGLIYWYFKDKQDLLFSLIRERVSAILHIVDHSEDVMEMPPQELLSTIGRSYLAIYHLPSNRSLLRIVITEAIRMPEIGETLYQVAPVHVLHLLSSYFQRRIDQGRLRPLDTHIAARSFIGMLVVQIVAREILRQPEALAASDEQIVETVVDIFLRGMEGRG
ncbi:MAG: TetR/AcrR family transcriptional regulator [Blastochloris sp.]|nr:TetR/AcrR family transcriptional regulator [Blastochloris sp.]